MIARLRPKFGLEEFIAAWKGTKGEQDIITFEEEFASLLQVKHAISFPYGRTGLILLLKALDLENQEIICPAYTCVVVPHAIVYSGNEPIFVDSQELDFNMNLDLAEKAINENTGAIIATSIFGYPVDLEKIKKIRERYPHLKIIQDCAHSFAAEWKGNPVYKAGDAAIFGLNISKLMSSIFGGMVTTDDDILAERLRHLRASYIKVPTKMKEWQRRLYITATYPSFYPPIYSFINRLERSGLLDRLTKYYQDGSIDMPSDYLIGMSGVEANVGRVQVKKYRDIIMHRRAMAEYYNQSLRGVDALQLPLLEEGATYSHYVIRVKNREKVMSFMLRKGIQLGQLIEYCIPEMEAYKNRQGNRYNYTVASTMAKETINLPLWVGRGQANRCISKLKDYFRR